MANERTLLAWVRTAVAFMGFGVAIAKLSVLLQIDALEHPEVVDQLPDAGLSQLVGAGLVALGGIIAILGGLQAKRWSAEVRGPTPRGSALAITVGMAVVTSVELISYLLL